MIIIKKVALLSLLGFGTALCMDDNQNKRTLKIFIKPDFELYVHKTQQGLKTYAGFWMIDILCKIRYEVVKESGISKGHLVTTVGIGLLAKLGRLGAFFYTGYQGYKTLQQMELKKKYHSSNNERK